MQSRAEKIDVVVVGGGVVGASAALEAGRKGARVALLERAGLDIAAGSSKGSARILAPAAYPDASYLEMGLAALDAWRLLETEVESSLLRETGVLSVGEFAAQELPALLAAGEEAELIDADDARRRFAVTLDGERPILHQPRSGVLDAHAARTALLELGRRENVAMHERETVQSISDLGDRVEVATDRGNWTCETTIVATGPWSRRLLAGAGIELAVEVSAQSVAYFPLASPDVAPVALIEFDGDEPYALWDPVRGLKAAFHVRGRTVDPDDAEAGEPSAAEIERLAVWVAERFGALATGSPVAEPCLYSNTADEHFVIERHGRIVAVSACNGQGFQLAPESGRRAAELAAEALGAPAS